MFSIIHDLDKLNKEELTEYLRAASVHFGLDPDLNALDVIRMPDPLGGPGKLVAYARRGTTDILRGIKKITVDSLTNCSGPGFIAYQAVGHNPEGRQEIAIGAHDIEGFRGEKLAFAVMTAQTRALRRLTLQFVGGGLLDESEVTSVSNLALAAASNAQLSGSVGVIPPPQVTPSMAPGKDITQNPPNEGVSLQSAVLSEPLVKDKGEGDAVDTGTTLNPPLAEPEKKRKGRGPNKKRNVVSLETPVQAERPVGFIDADGKIESITPLVQPPLIVYKDGIKQTEFHEAQAQAEFEKRQAQLREDAIRSLDKNRKSGEWVSYPEHATITIPPGFKGFETAAAAPARMPIVVPEPEPQTAPAAPPQVPPEIPLEKKQEYTQRFSQYCKLVISDDLGAAKMRPSGIGGVTAKFKAFARKVTNVEREDMEAKHWDMLFEELDNYLASNGAASLVKYINETIGDKD